jgi:hypothetical protein
MSRYRFSEAEFEGSEEVATYANGIREPMNVENLWKKFSYCRNFISLDGITTKPILSDFGKPSRCRYESFYQQIVRKWMSAILFDPPRDMLRDAIIV